MILALEGPDRAGKTTIFHRLAGYFPGVRLVPGAPLQACLLPHMAAVEERNSFLWQHLWDGGNTLCDRHFSVSGQVYDELYGRKPNIDYRCWHHRVVPVYFDVPIAELERRHAATGDDLFDVKRYEEVCKLYAKVLPLYTNYSVVRANQPVHCVLADCISIARKVWPE